MASKEETKFQSKLVDEIQERFPESLVLRTDPQQIQGIPDLIILHENKWAALECKKDKNSSHRPNQPYYVNKMNAMSFASFIYPENKEDVLNDMERSFRA